MTEVRTATIAEQTVARVEWGPIIAGSLVAAAVAMVLHGFAAGVGVSVTSSAPTWRDASIALVLLSGLYLLVVGLASYGLGAYVAGRLRPRLGAGPNLAFSDGMHGLLVWALRHSPDRFDAPGIGRERLPAGSAVRCFCRSRSVRGW